MIRGHDVHVYVMFCDVLHKLGCRLIYKRIGEHVYFPVGVKDDND